MSEEYKLPNRQTWRSLVKLEAEQQLKPSPDPRHIQHVKHCSVQRCFMSLWQIDELLDCQKLIYPRVSEKSVTERYEYWGGVARSCFKPPNLDKLDVILCKENSAISIIQRIVQPEGFYNENFWLNHQWLTLMKPAKNLTSFEFIFPSFQIQNMFPKGCSNYVKTISYRNQLLNTGNDLAYSAVRKFYITSISNMFKKFPLF